MKLLFALSLTILVSVCIGGEDFYKMLGVKRTATTREIRRAFKKMAIDNHPDKNRVCRQIYRSIDPIGYIGI